MRKVIVNSTPIISLSIIGKLNLLDKLYDTIIIPNAVYNEVVKAGKSKVGAKNLQNANFIKIMTIVNKEAEKIFSTSLHI